MGRLILSLARALNALCSARPVRSIFRQPALGDRSSPAAFLEWEYRSTPLQLALFAPHHRIEDLDIMDVGCGMGGKSVWMARHGARSVAAVDTDVSRLDQAGKFAATREASGIRLAAADAASLPFPSRAFDRVLFNDSFEHLAEPENALREAERVLRPGGLALLSFPPYGSPWGAHLFGRIPIPWAHLILPAETILELWREYDTKGCGTACPGAPRGAPAAIDVHSLFHLNRMTVGGFLDMVRRTAFDPLLVRLDAVAGIPPLLARSRPLREHLVRRVVAVLRRREE